MTVRARMYLLSGILALPLSVRAQTCDILYSFSSDAGSPVTGLLLATDGSFYGTTAEGGVYGFGSIYRLTPIGSGSWTFATLHSFNGQDGIYPAADLIQASDGMIYGTAIEGGGSDSHDTVFRIDLDGNFTPLGLPGGAYPHARLAEMDGFIYGTVSQGGYLYFGGVFRFDLALTTFELIHSFSQAEGG